MLLQSRRTVDLLTDLGNEMVTHADIVNCIITLLLEDLVCSSSEKDRLSLPHEKRCGCDAIISDDGGCALTI